MSKKQRNENEPQDENIKVKGETADASETAGNCAESSADEDKGEGAASFDAKEGESAKAKKQPSDMDFMKLFLSQSQEELKKQKDENERLKAQNEQLSSQVPQLKEKYDRLVAEYENYRRRTAMEKESIGTEKTSKAVLALLPALDNLERAMPFAQSNSESFVKGVEMTLRQLEEAFRSLGVEEIEAQGAVFDPELHDAVMHVEDESLGESVVTDVFQKGYKIGDKVVRHSVVKVAN